MMMSARMYVLITPALQCLSAFVWVCYLSVAQLRFVLPYGKFLKRVLHQCCGCAVLLSLEDPSFLSSSVYSSALTYECVFSDCVLLFHECLCLYVPYMFFLDQAGCPRFLCNPEPGVAVKCFIYRALMR